MRDQKEFYSGSFPIEAVALSAPKTGRGIYLKKTREDWKPNGVSDFRKADFLLNGTGTYVEAIISENWSGGFGWKAEKRINELITFKFTDKMPNRGNINVIFSCTSAKSHCQTC